MTSDREVPRRWIMLAGMLTLAVGLSLVPRRVSVPLRNGMQTSLEPGQKVSGYVLASGHAMVTWIQAARHASATIASLEQETRSWKERYRQLQLQMLRMREEQPLQLAAGWGTVETAPPLLVPRLKEARFLGQDTAAFLWQHRRLDVGAHQGVQPQTLVLDISPELEAAPEQSTRRLLDQGRIQGTKEGFTVLSGRVILGQVAEVGPYTSTVQLVTDAGYRDLVRIAHQSPEGPQWVAHGVLEGAGGEWCRVRHVPYPVAPGDWVYSARGEGVLPHPLYYGEVVRTELEPGGNQWQLWVRPAGHAMTFSRVYVLQAHLNPVRLVHDEEVTAPRR